MMFNKLSEEGMSDIVRSYDVLTRNCLVDAAEQSCLVRELVKIEAQTDSFLMRSLWSWWTHKISAFEELEIIPH